MINSTPPTITEPSSAVPEGSHLVHAGRSATPSDSMVGRRIKDLRRRNGLTQKQVAARVGVTGAQFHRYEVGTTRVAASRLMDIATALGVRPADLMSEEMPRGALPLPLPASLPTSNDLVELVEMFSSISDRRRRGAVVTFARSLATASPATAPTVPAEAA
jgi:transcriptional regulator with XRE-family HTH domain